MEPRWALLIRIVVPSHLFRATPRRDPRRASSSLESQTAEADGRHFESQPARDLRRYGEPQRLAKTQSGTSVCCCKIECESVWLRADGSAARVLQQAWQSCFSVRLFRKPRRDPRVEAGEVRFTSQAQTPEPCSYLVAAHRGPPGSDHGSSIASEHVPSRRSGTSSRLAPCFIRSRPHISPGYGASNAVPASVVMCESLLARRVTGGVDHSAIPLVCRGSERLQFSSLERLCVRAAAPVLWPGRANRSW
jgi:hypothetical protein